MSDDLQRKERLCISFSSERPFFREIERTSAGKKANALGALTVREYVGANTRRGSFKIKAKPYAGGGDAGNLLHTLRT